MYFTGRIPAFLFVFVLFNNNFSEKFKIRWIQTRIVRVEDEYAYHLTTSQRPYTVPSHMVFV